MGEIKVKMPDNIERIFRKIAMKRYGYNKGSISAAAQRAIEEWIDTYVEVEVIKDPIEKISGLMKHIKKKSVELQHEAWVHIGEKHVNRH